MALITAIALKRNNPGEEIQLSNIGPSFGGNSKSFIFEGRAIDFGMQTYFDCGIKWVDEIVREAMEASKLEYNEFSWPNHDPCITLQKGELYSSVFPVHSSDYDLNDYERVFSELPVLELGNDRLKDVLVAYFGNEIWKEVFLPIAQKFCSTNIDDLSAVSLSAVPWGRIYNSNLSDEELVKRPGLFSKIAVSDSNYIPTNNENYKRNTIYPKNGGIAAVIECLKSLAISLDIDIKENLKWEDISYKNERLIICGAEADQVFWTLPNKRLNLLVNNEFQASGGLPFSGSHIGVYCEQGFNETRAHYLLSFDDDDIFRMTFYGNLAGEHYQSYASVELLSSPDDFSENELTDFCKKVGLISEGARCKFSVPSYSPWPISFKAGYTQERDHEEELLKRRIKNLTLLNANPAKSSIMQTPTLRSRLIEVNL